ILIEDYASIGGSPDRHPMELWRPRLPPDVVATRNIAISSAGPLRVAGLVAVRQAPSSAGGFVFLSLEDETGLCDVVVDPRLAARARRELSAPSLLVEGELSIRQGARSVRARRLIPLRRALSGAATTRSDRG
ncbi:MAG: error-prone DNA polymerase, partial [Sandaracinaceae bacterium]|nr:error-prone DNA polymerase [Sandaracinaceae bacterium]